VDWTSVEQRTRLSDIALVCGACRAGDELIRKPDSGLRAGWWHKGQTGALFHCPAYAIHAHMEGEKDGEDKET